MPDIGVSKDALRAVVGLSGEFVGTTDSATLTTKTINTTDNTLTATSQEAGDILKNNGTKFVRLARGSANQPLKVNSGGTDLDYGTLPVAGGGTGAATLTAGVVIASGTSAFTTKANPAGAFIDDSSTQTIIGLKTFTDQTLKLRNPANTFSGQIWNPDVTSDIILDLFNTLPTYIVYQDSRDSLFKVKSGRRGQIDGSYANPEDAINFAISIGNNALIQLRPVTYNLSAGFAGFTALGINTIIDATRAAINVPAGYSGSVWTVNPSSTPLLGTGVIGGKYSQVAGASPRLWTCIDLHSTLFAAQVNGCFFKDMEITNAGKAIALRTEWDSVNGGVINGNIFSNIRITTTNIGVSFEHTGTYTSGLTGSNRNRFDNLMYQGFTSSTNGVKDVNGRDNEFNSCVVWDLSAYAPSAVSCNITANAQWTRINGGALTYDNFADLSTTGNQTTVDDENLGDIKRNRKSLSYEDLVAISAPASPSTGTIRRYTKTIDSNNDGLFYKTRLNGAVVEVQI